MAKFDKIPKTEQELLDIAIENGQSKTATTLLAAYRYIKEHHNVEDPFSLTTDSGKRFTIKVIRFLATDQQLITKLKSIAPSYNFTPGDGYRTKRGIASVGTTFETILENDIKEFIRSGEDGNIEKNNLRFIKELWSHYDLDKAKNITVRNDAGNRTRRPLNVTSTSVNLGNGSTDIGKQITDLTILVDGKDRVYLSLKVMGFSYFNLGVAKLFPEAEIKQGSIKNSAGINLLNMYGINNEKFCKVFNSYQTASNLRREEERANFNKSTLTNFLKQAIGKSYHFVRKMSDGSIQHYEMTETKLNEKTKVNNVTVVYPYGSAKKIYVNIGDLSIEFRNTGGGIYPTFMLGYYRAK